VRTIPVVRSQQLRTIYNHYWNLAMSHATSDGFSTIEPGVAYSLDDFKRRTGMGAAAIRTARRKSDNPLIVRRVGRRAYIMGEDFIAYLQQHGRDFSEKYRNADD